MKSERDDPYKILGLSQTATREEIKAAYKSLVLQSHPDKLTDASPEEKKEITKRFREIQEAYKTLTSPDAKQAPDSAPLLTVNPLEVEYLRAQFPTLTHQEIDEFAEIIEIIPFDKDAIIELIKGDKGKRSIHDITFDNIDLQNHTKLCNLPYQPHLMKRLTVEEIKEKFDELKVHYGSVENICNDFTFLWKAQKPGCGDILIFGTMHAMSPGFYRFIDALNALIEKSDLVMTEIIFPECGKGSLDMSQHKSIDSYIANRAHALGKLLRALETPEMVKASGALDSLKESIKTYKLREAARVALLSQDTEVQRNVLQKLISMGDSNKHSTALRNMLWMETILQASHTEKKSIFIACGAAHMRGASSIPNFLHHEGYTLTPLMKLLPLSTDSLLRQAPILRITHHLQMTASLNEKDFCVRTTPTRAYVAI